MGLEELTVGMRASSDGVQEPERWQSGQTRQSWDLWWWAEQIIGGWIGGSVCRHCRRFTGRTHRTASCRDYRASFNFNRMQVLYIYNLIGQYINVSLCEWVLRRSLNGISVWKGQCLNGIAVWLGQYILYDFDKRLNGSAGTSVLPTWGPYLYADCDFWCQERPVYVETPVMYRHKHQLRTVHEIFVYREQYSNWIFSCVKRTVLMASESMFTQWLQHVVWMPMQMGHYSCLRL